LCLQQRFSGYFCRHYACAGDSSCNGFLSIRAPSAIAVNRARARHSGTRKFHNGADNIAASFDRRFVIWEFASDRIFERPLFGWGLDASRDIPGGQSLIHLFDLNDGRTATGQALPLHPHNAVIQIWLELGIVGLALLVGLFAFAVMATARAMNRFAQAATAATVMSAFVMAQLGFGVWQGWWLAALATITIFTAIVARPGHD